MRYRLGLASLLILVAATACSGTSGEATPSSEDGAESTSTTTTEATAPAVHPLLSLDSSTVEALVSDAANVGVAIGDAINDPDVELFASMFNTGATFTDPVNPSMTPDVRFLHELYGGGTIGSDALAEKYPDRALPHGDSVLEASFGNRHGAATVGYFEVDPPVGRLAAIRQLPITDGKADWGMHRLEVEMLRSYPDEIVALLYLSASDSERVADIVAMADTFSLGWADAWSTRDPATLAALYADDTTRHDALIADLTGGDPSEWYTLLLSAYPSLDMHIDSIYASSFGPAAIYHLTADTTSDSCTMTLVSIWNLTDQGQIEDEWVYYSPDDVLDCNWTS